MLRKYNGDKVLDSPAGSATGVLVFHKQNIHSFVF